MVFLRLGWKLFRRSCRTGDAGGDGSAYGAHVTFDSGDGRFR